MTQARAYFVYRFDWDLREAGICWPRWWLAPSATRFLCRREYRKIDGQLVVDKEARFETTVVFDLKAIVDTSPDGLIAWNLTNFLPKDSIG